MNGIQKTLIAGAIVASVGFGFYEAKLVSRIREQMQVLLVQKDSLTEQNQQLLKERDQISANLAAAERGTERSRGEQAELLRLRAEVSRLRGESRELARVKGSAPTSNDPIESETKSWVGRVSKLKEKLGQLPDQRIPELQFLTDQDWLDSVRDLKHLETEGDASQALTALRNAAKGEFAGMVQNALKSYAKASNGQVPADISELKPYFGTPVDDSVLQRYEIVQPGTVTAKSSPLDDQDDKYYQISRNTIGSSSVAENILQQVMEAYTIANGGQSPTDPNQLVPYIKTPAQQIALQKLIQKGNGK